jgi:catechol 2,3-dioxygenase-like lactoylglutathione lyase family enzyme
MELHAVTYLARNYDETIAWFVTCLGFEVLEDTQLADAKRWVRIGKAGGISMLVAKAIGAEQVAAVGKAAGGRVAYFLHTNDFANSRRRMQAAGVRFTEEPRYEPYGTVAVFLDLHGNKWDLVEPKQKPG